METVALDALGGVAAGDGEYFGDSRHRAMESRIKARHLRQFGVSSSNCLNLPNFARQVLGIVRCNPAQFRKQFGRDLLRRRMFHAVHHPVPHGLHERECRLRFQPVQEKIDRFQMVSGDNSFWWLRFSRWAVDYEICPAQANPVNFSRKQPTKFFSRLINYETDARRPAVESQYAGWRRFHE